MIISLEFLSVLICLGSVWEEHSELKKYNLIATASLDIRQMDLAQKSKLLDLHIWWVDGRVGSARGYFIAAEMCGKDAQPNKGLSYLQNILLIQLSVSMKVLSEAGSCWQL